MKCYIYNMYREVKKLSVLYVDFDCDLNEGNCEIIIIIEDILMDLCNEMHVYGKDIDFSFY